MTFDELKGAVKDYCNLSSTEADTRVGKAINRHYRRVTSSLGLDAARFVSRNQSTTNGVRTVIFTEIEKIDRVIDATDSNAIVLLTEVSLDAIRSTQPGTGAPTRWALQNTDADSVTIVLDTLPQTTYSLQADGTTTLSDLTGSNEPIFPESYHDILVWFVLSEELLKKEKDKLAATYAAKATTLLNELRFYLADSPGRDTRQGAGTVAGASGSSGGSGSLGGTAYTQTGLITFDRDPSYPFAVTASSAKVDNLDADKLDGFDESAFAKLADAEAVTGAYTFSGIANTGLRVLDTNASHALSIVPGSNITAARTLTLTTGDADRTLTINGSLTLDDWFNQSVKTTATPTFAGAKLADTDASHVVTVTIGSNITANRALSLVTGDADRTITLNGSPTLNDWFDQSVKVAAGPTFAGVTLSADVGFSASALLRRTTSDGSDSGVLELQGGGATGNTRGGGLLVYGNEHGSFPGATRLVLGNVSGSKFQLVNNAGTTVIEAPGGEKNVYIGDTSNAKATQGLTVNQGASDDEIVSLKSSDVAHLFTSPTEADSYGILAKVVDTTGGLAITGLTEDLIGLQLRGAGSSSTSTRSTAADAPVVITAAKDNANAYGGLNADTNILVVKTLTTTRFIMDSDGDSHQDVGTAWTNFDDGDDLARLEAVAVTLAREGDPLRDAFVRHFDAHRDVIAAMPGKALITFNDDGHHFVNMSRLVMLLTGAVRQLAARLDTLERTPRGERHG